MTHTHIRSLKIVSKSSTDADHFIWGELRHWPPFTPFIHRVKRMITISSTVQFFHRCSVNKFVPTMKAKDTSRGAAPSPLLCRAYNFNRIPFGTTMFSSKTFSLSLYSLIPIRPISIEIVSVSRTIYNAGMTVKTIQMFRSACWRVLHYSICLIWNNDMPTNSNRNQFP